MILEQHVGRPIELDLVDAKALEQLLFLDATDAHCAWYGSPTADCLPHMIHYSLLNHSAQSDYPVAAGA